LRFLDGDIPGKKFGRDVEMPERLLPVLKKHALAHPDGKIFRNEDSNPWTHYAEQPAATGKKKFHNFRSTWCSGRHTKATDLLENGASTGAVASLLGHRDPIVVLKFYGRHIEKRREHLRRLIGANDQRGLIEKTDQPPQPPEPANGQE
jgi:integrase